MVTHAAGLSSHPTPPRRAYITPAARSCLLSAPATTVAACPARTGTFCPPAPTLRLVPCLATSSRHASRCMLLRLFRKLNILRLFSRQRHAAAATGAKNSKREGQGHAQAPVAEGEQGMRASPAHTMNGSAQAASQQPAMDGPSTSGSSGSAQYGSSVQKLSEHSLRHFANWTRYSSQRPTWSAAMRDQVRVFGRGRGRRERRRVRAGRQQACSRAITISGGFWGFGRSC